MKDAPLLWMRVGTVLAAVLCYFLAYQYLLFLFYDEGLFLLDAGWFSALLSGNDWRLRAPIALDNAGESYYRTHISPFLLIFTYLPLPLEPALKKSLFLALPVALYGGVLYAAIYDYLMQSAAAANKQLTMCLALLALVAAVVIAFNGVTVDILTYAHFEIWLPVFICTFLGAMVFGKKHIALLVFVLLLTVRQDAGFHFVSATGVLLAVLHWRAAKMGKSVAATFAVYKTLWIYTIIAFVVALILINIAGRELHDAGVEFSLYLKRLLDIFTNTGWMVAVLVLVWWGGVAKQPLMLLGLLFVLPWILYNAVLELPLPGSLGAYYAFPLLIIFYWHFIATRFFAVFALPHKSGNKHKKKKSPKGKYNTAVYMAAFVALFMLATGALRNQHFYRVQESTLKKASIVKLVDVAVVNPMPANTVRHTHQLKNYYEKIRADNNIFVMEDFATLFPHIVPYDRILRLEFQKRLFYDKMDMLILTNRSSVVSSLPVIVAAFYVNRLNFVYRLADTNYVLFSKTALCDENQQCVDDLPLLKVAANSFIKQITDIAAEKYVEDGFRFDGGVIAADGVATEESIAVMQNSVNQDVTVPERAAVSDAAGIMAQLHGVRLQGPGIVGIRAKYSYDAAVTVPPIMRLFNADGSHHDEALPINTPGQASDHVYILHLPEGITTLNLQIIHPGTGKLTLNAVEISPSR